MIKLGGDMNVQRGQRAVLAALLALLAADEVFRELDRREINGEKEKDEENGQ